MSPFRMAPLNVQRASSLFFPRPPSAALRENLPRTYSASRWLLVLVLQDADIPLTVPASIHTAPVTKSLRWMF